MSLSPPSNAACELLADTLNRHLDCQDSVVPVVSSPLYSSITVPALGTHKSRVLQIDWVSKDRFGVYNMIFLLQLTILLSHREPTL
jgi:hypothetical protein